MEHLIELVLSALRAAGIHCVRALDKTTLPRLKSPMVAVGTDPSLCRQNALSRYLGQDSYGNERYGMQLEAKLQLEVYSPGRQDGAMCDSAAEQVITVFLRGIEGLFCGDIQLGRTEYDPKTDCFRRQISVPLALRLYTTAYDGEFTHFIIKGNLK